MGDLGPSAPPPVDGEVSSPPVLEDITVLVTGFGPFKDHPLNPSYLIASSLPSSIPFPTPSPSPPSSDANSTPPPPTRKIQIHTHPAPLRVSYSAVRNAVPALLNSYAQTHDGKRPDIIIHIGVAAQRQFYSVETLAHRDGYTMADVDGRVGFDDGERRWKGDSLPDILRPGPVSDTKSNVDTPTTLATTTRSATETLSTGEPSPSFSTTKSPSPTPPTATAVSATATASTSTPQSTRITPYPPDPTFLKQWISLSPKSADLRLSHDAGRYLCEFIFYTSLAQALQEGHPRSVVFFHVPKWTDDENLEKGRDVAIGLIETLASSWVGDGEVVR
ncbi:hypothetical protein FQN54_006794 [Arachnomyces sp. PD_36]|nr:hypothetical protein FQN54_006794 [Arachnomyces sp. PD_36]